MLTSQEIKEYALNSGADLVGIGSISRFEGTSPEHDPRFIAPKAKSIIGLGFRVLRGSLRGVEEGTLFYQFPEMGIVHIDEVHAPAVLRRVSCFLEDNGFEGVVLRSVPDRRRGEDKGTNPERYPTFKIQYSQPVALGKPAPDVLMNFNQAAVICGVGEMGLGGFVLTERFGSLQRFAFILTDAELEPDPLIQPRLCDHCGECIKACPGQAISQDGKLDEWQCTAYRKGTSAETNPFLTHKMIAELPEGDKVNAGEKRFEQALIKQYAPLLDEAYPPVRFGYSQSICGVACQRACLVHLENKNILKDKFVHKFRDKPIWHLD
jgi:ferredoxin